MAWQLVLFLHLLAATIWIGGQITIFLAAPLIRRHAGAAERDVLGAVGRVFGAASGAALLVLLVTGMAQAHHLGWSLADDPFGNETYRLITEKLALVLLMIVVSALHGVVGVRVARGAIAGSRRSAVRWLSIANLLLGLAALWAAADLGT